MFKWGWNSDYLSHRQIYFFFYVEQGELQELRMDKI